MTLKSAGSETRPNGGATHNEVVWETGRGLFQSSVAELARGRRWF